MQGLRGVRWGRGRACKGGQRGAEGWPIRRQGRSWMRPQGWVVRAPGAAEVPQQVCMLPVSGVASAAGATASHLRLQLLGAVYGVAVCHRHEAHVLALQPRQLGSQVLLASWRPHVGAAGGRLGLWQVAGAGAELRVKLLVGGTGNRCVKSEGLLAVSCSHAMSPFEERAAAAAIQERCCCQPSSYRDASAAARPR